MKEEATIYAIAPPDESALIDFPLIRSMASTEERAWDLFLAPALRKEGFVNDGFKAVKVRLTLEVI